MNHKQYFLLTFIIITIIICFFLACNEKPAEPEYDNPFDIIENTDPLQLTAQIANGGVTLAWVIPSFEGLKSFKIYRSEQETTGYVELDSVQSSEVQYIDETIKNGHSYWYVVTAIDDNNKESSRTNIAAINIKTEPVLIINGNEEYAPSRNVSLTILSNTATQMLLSNNPDFSDADWESYTTSRAWTLAVGEGKKTVYMKVKFYSTESPVVSASVTPQPINPAVAIFSDSTQYTSTRVVPLTLSALGDSLKMKISEDSTFTGLNWRAFSSSENFTLSIGDGQKTVYMKIKNNFEIESSLAFDNIFPQPIHPTITIANGAKYTNIRDVPIAFSASGSNLQMKISEDSTFTSINWQTFSASENFTLSTGEGIKTVYLRLKNDFEIESDNIFDTMILDTTPPLVVLTVSPDSGITNETNFRFDPTASSDNFAPLQDMQVRFDYSNDGYYDTNWQQATIISHQYTIGGGDKIAHMQLKDGAGNQVDTTVTVFVNTHPQASFTAAEYGFNSKKWYFDASASSDYEDEENIEYRWDFDGDNLWDTDWLTQDTTSFTFASYGNYISKLNVRDQNQLTSEKKQILNIFYYEEVTDIDGNVYKAVKIGDQWWMAENLKVTHYRNGDAIPNVTDKSEWEYYSAGAYCAYDNDNSNVDIYGLLYNGFAIIDSRDIAPEGWHVPTNEEWNTLISYLGGKEVAGDKLKAMSGWNNSGNGTNMSGFAALPGGTRQQLYSTFFDLGRIGTWWTDSGNEYYPTRIQLHEYNSEVDRLTSKRQRGCSVRCVRD